VEIGLSGITIAKLQTDYSAIIDFIFLIDPANMETYSECICMLLRLPWQNVQMKSLGAIILNKVISFQER
jgi:hypothetical protein